ncbi:MAG TPA: 4Fe-4S dicluster domain-containing protein [Thermoanaerobaculia bacterium]|nr:4Fe-4S dicluster domain-containing protein [Thermoanaerobaculia bacterium]
MFTVSPAAFDGRYGNNAWLQELPDPVSKVCWTNAALVSPATARELGVEDGDVVQLAAGGREIELPVVVQPGQADGSVAVALGYGRTAAGRVAQGLGANAYALRTAAAPWFTGGLEVTRTGRRTELARTQEHWWMEGRDLVRTVEAGAEPHGQHAGEDAGEGHGAIRLWDPPELGGRHQWGMAIDLAACTGCNACVVACQSENNIPVVGPEQVRRGREMHWLRVDRYFIGTEDDPDTAFQPVPCMHCENAPCEQVCPVAATVHDAEGINAMVYNRCIGTRYCSNNCPYKVRRFNYFHFTKDTPELMMLAMNPEVTVRSRGVMEKCTYCIQRINAGKADAKRAGRELADGEIQTACQQTCPADAIVFGDLAAEGTRVNGWKASPRNYVLLEELNNFPRTSYLARTRNPNPDWERA